MSTYGGALSGEGVTRTIILDQLSSYVGRVTWTTVLEALSSYGGGLWSAVR
jgi:hypothetical protein